MIQKNIKQEERGENFFVPCFFGPWGYPIVSNSIDSSASGEVFVEVIEWLEGQRSSPCSPSSSPISPTVKLSLLLFVLVLLFPLLFPLLLLPPPPPPPRPTLLLLLLPFIVGTHLDCVFRSVVITFKSLPLRRCQNAFAPSFPIWLLLKNKFLNILLPTWNEKIILLIHK